jgi:hypothetical protein
VLPLLLLQFILCPHQLRRQLLDFVRSCCQRVCCSCQPGICLLLPVVKLLLKLLLAQQSSLQLRL